MPDCVCIGEESTSTRTLIAGLAYLDIWQSRSLEFSADMQNAKCKTKNKKQKNFHSENSHDSYTRIYLV